MAFDANGGRKSGLSLGWRFAVWVLVVGLWFVFLGLSISTGFAVAGICRAGLGWGCFVLRISPLRSRV
jgi:hypothetical protein